jgi:bla regulator protein BlaR1
VTLAILAFVSASKSPPWAQSPETQLTDVQEWQVAAGGKMTFDVASVRMSPTFVPPIFGLDLADSYGTSDPQGHFFATFPLSSFIGFAYKLTFTPEQKEAMEDRLPKWFANDFFQINARAEGNPTKDQMRVMMQSLLADRFNLKIHFETREVTAYAIVLRKSGKTGPKLRPHAEGPPCDLSQRSPSGDSPAKDTDVYPPVCDRYKLISKSKGVLLLGSRNTTMALLAAYLPSVEDLGRPLVDETGLSGRFDFTLEWTPEEDGPSTSETGTAIASSDATFLEAVKEQLGLEFKAAKAPLRILVIDHIEKPSEN